MVFPMLIPRASRNLTHPLVDSSSVLCATGLLHPIHYSLFFVHWGKFKYIFLGWGKWIMSDRVKSN